jgi:class 3 adenylate cyclase
VAARVQALAERGTVLVTASLQRQVAGLFVAEDREAHALKGVRNAGDRQGAGAARRVSRLAWDQVA